MGSRRAAPLRIRTGSQDYASEAIPGSPAVSEDALLELPLILSGSSWMREGWPVPVPVSLLSAGCIGAKVKGLLNRKI